MDITSTITGYFDVAQLTLYLFWIFFFGLIFWIQRENMREGFPLVSERTGEELPAATIPLPDPKTFRLPHGGGELTVPGPNQGDTRPVAAERTGADDSFPLLRSRHELVFEFAERGITHRHHVICFCGVGYSASQLYFAARYAGFPRVSLYDGSMVDWSARGGELVPGEL